MVLEYWLVDPAAKELAQEPLYGGRHKDFAADRVMGREMRTRTILLSFIHER